MAGIRRRAHHILLNSFRNFTPHFFNFYFQIILPSAPMFPTKFTFPYQNFVRISDAIKSATCLALPNLPYLILVMHIATRIWGTSSRNSGLDSRQKQKNVSFSNFHTGPGLVHPLVQCVPGALFSVLKRPGREANTRSYTPLPLRVHGVTLR